MLGSETCKKPTPAIQVGALWANQQNHWLTNAPKSYSRSWLKPANHWLSRTLRQKRGRSGGFRGADAPADCSLSPETTTRSLPKTPTSQIPTGGWRGQQPRQAARGPRRAGRPPAPRVRCRGAARRPEYCPVPDSEVWSSGTDMTVPLELY